MTIINMFRGGEGPGGRGTGYNYNMYPRPDMTPKQMAENIGWENQPDHFHAVHLLDLCACHDKGAIHRAKHDDVNTESCELEVGDEFPMVWIPATWTIESVTLDVHAGVAGMLVDVKRYKVLSDENVISQGVVEAVELVDVDVSPIPGPVIDQAYLDSLGCKGRLDLDDFCKQCNKRGCYNEKVMTPPVLVGDDGTGRVCDFGGQYLSLVIKQLPEDFNCSSCCLKVSLGARVKVPFKGD